MKNYKWLAFIIGLSLVLKGQMNLEILIMSYVTGVLVTYFNKKIVEEGKSNLKFTPRSALIWLKYLGILVGQIVLANFQVAYIVLNPKLSVESEIVEYRTGIQCDRLKMILANSLTLTPGTITVDVKENIFKVHCLKDKFSQGLKDNPFEKLLLNIESL